MPAGRPTDPEYMDVSIPPGKEFTHSVKKGHTVFAYVFEGNGYFDENNEKLIESDHLVLFDDGDQIVAKARDEQLDSQLPYMCYHFML